MSRDIVRQQEEFGKDIGLVHEAVVTGRKIGAGKEFWSKLAHDEELFRQVVLQVRPPQLAGDWLEDILTKERKAHKDFFGQEFDLAGFQVVLEKYGTEAISRWQKLGLNPQYLPTVAMGQDTDFLGWKVKPEDWYCRQVATGKIFRRQPDGQLALDREAFKLEGITVLIDSRLKPQYQNGKQMFQRDNLLGPIIKQLREEGKIAKYMCGSQSSRFGVSADEWENHIKLALAEFLGVEVSQVRLERAIEASVIPQLYPHMPRKGDGETNTWVWYEEYFEGSSLRLHGGKSDYGGLSSVHYSYWAGDRWPHRAFRPLVVLGP